MEFYPHILTRKIKIKEHSVEWSIEERRHLKSPVSTRAPM